MMGIWTLLLTLTALIEMTIGSREMKFEDVNWDRHVDSRHNYRSRPRSTPYRDSREMDRDRESYDSDRYYPRRMDTDDHVNRQFERRRYEDRDRDDMKRRYGNHNDDEYLSMTPRRVPFHSRPRPSMDSESTGTPYTIMGDRNNGMHRDDDRDDRDWHSRPTMTSHRYRQSDEMDRNYDRHSRDRHDMDRHGMDQHDMDRHDMDRHGMDRHGMDRHDRDRHDMDLHDRDRDDMDRRPMISHRGTFSYVPNRSMNKNNDRKNETWMDSSDHRDMTTDETTIRESDRRRADSSMDGVSENNVVPRTIADELRAKVREQWERTKSSTQFPTHTLEQHHKRYPVPPQHKDLPTEDDVIVFDSKWLNAHQPTTKF